MAVLSRETPRLHLPDDFGLGLAVTAIIGGLLLLALVVISAAPTQGPRGEANQPDAATTYTDFIPRPAPTEPSLMGP